MPEGTESERHSPDVVPSQTPTHPPIYQVPPHLQQAGKKKCKGDRKRVIEENSAASDTVRSGSITPEGTESERHSPDAVPPQTPTPPHRYQAPPHLTIHTPTCDIPSGDRSTTPPPLRYPWISQATSLHSDRPHHRNSLLSQDGTIIIPVSPTPPQCLPPQPQNPTQRSTLPKRKQSIQNQGCSLDWENAREIFTSEVQCITQHSQTIPELHHIQPHITIGHNPSPTPTQRPTPTKMKQSIQNQGCSLDWENAREIFTSGAQHITQKSQTTLELRQIHTDIPIYHISTNCIPYNCISSHCIAPNPASLHPTSSDSTPSHCSTNFPLHHLLFTAVPL